MRADLYLVRRGYAPSREAAKVLIADGSVLLDGERIRKPSEEIADGEHEVEVQNALRYVGRGGLKLEAALDAFGTDVRGRTAADIGASTGGFTDCMLQRGAASVVAVDSGTGQLAERLRSDPRVTSLEHCNARYLTAEMLGGRVDLIVMDISFISATYIIPGFPGLLAEGGEAICLIKPQFEVGRAMIGKGGIVRDPAAHRAAIERVLDSAKSAGLFPDGLIPSPITGGDGNREFLVHFSTTSAQGEIGEKEISSAVGGVRRGGV